MPAMRYLTVLAAAALFAGSTAAPSAGADPVAGHQVTYTVTTTSDLTATSWCLNRLRCSACAAAVPAARPRHCCM